MEGLGDLIEIITVNTGIKKIVGKNCEGCRKRRQWINKKVPFKSK